MIRPKHTTLYCYTIIQFKYNSMITIQCNVLTSKQVFFLLLMEGSLVNKRDLLALYTSGIYCHKTGTRSPSYATPRQPTKILIFVPFNLTPRVVAHFSASWYFGKAKQMKRIIKKISMMRVILSAIMSAIMSAILSVLSCALFWRTKHKLWGT